MTYLYGEVKTFCEEVKYQIDIHFNGCKYFSDINLNTPSIKVSGDCNDALWIIRRESLFKLSFKRSIDFFDGSENKLFGVEKSFFYPFRNLSCLTWCDGKRYFFYERYLINKGENFYFDNNVVLSFTKEGFQADVFGVFDVEAIIPFLLWFWIENISDFHMRFGD